MRFQDYEIRNRYFTAGYSLPMFLGWIDPVSGKWVIQRDPYESLIKGKTFPHRLSGTMKAGDRSLMFTIPFVSKKTGRTIATFFPYNDESISNLSQTITGEGTSYYTPPEPTIGAKIGKSLRGLLLVLSIVFIASVYIKAKVK